ncbi:N-acetylmannosamine-6-phosphate 2-epimerase [Aerococcus sanguinicola]|uniref:N-acetylmannosamine-6-phosphate 2-epimerase n=1 Tax=unclassified Aerococcus TaxID=2618060 RepID=UPI0008A1C1FF|nr:MULTISPECIES: N-acetylmannosamine-6-phosphate 2-epimerase [unclassified Aerococcus]KAB0647380.1 N-acetylmannosamine-6-phosphate 2-epimerase [Aerococcus sanguinicola]MDK6233156.1 N-acetylmannosamine-6-phosphate 2-epimerase [Aerococcus sp. UMB10185]MDK6855637.1 N-acetylmannosamine-6-phosphate 2-epimerase [Aerococcus sp. UMB7533]MDK8502412.1 N-acetylmannosamine-6-phosphate 2-epimerase [Aerococcus sp. UMB1112A]OFN00327.1 N-acetylmannosamine-6-phosphate 2-epimerase [Aerococcus sp. HMSC062A02]
MLESAKGELIVSCQALDDEPLHSSYIMSRMAVAAQEGGAKGIRSNSVADIEAIKEVVDLPIIGIIKQDYPDAEIYITPTMKEIDALVATGVEVIALDATVSKRPNNQKLEDFVKEIKAKYPDQALMADCSTLDEMLEADRLGFDYIGTTMVGYTEQSKELKIEANDFELIRQALGQVDHPIIAEGNIDTPDKARRVLDLGVYSVVVGSAITRPQLITEKFVTKIHQ